MVACSAFRIDVFTGCFDYLRPWDGDFSFYLYFLLGVVLDSGRGKKMDKEQSLMGHAPSVGSVGTFCGIGDLFSGNINLALYL